MGNLDLARQGAHVMDTLAQYDHLPAAGFVMVSQRPTGMVVTLGFYASFPEAHRSVALWAQAFTSPVRLLLSEGGSRVKARVDTGSFAIELDEVAHNFQVVGYASRLGLTAVWEKPLSVAPFLLLGAVEAEMAVAS